MKSVCPQCGMSMDEKVDFCPTCGSKMNVIDAPSKTFENNNDMNNTYGSENNSANNSSASNNEQNSDGNPALNAAMNNSSPDLDSVMNNGNNNFNNAQNSQQNAGNGVPPIPPVYNNQPNMNMGNGNIPPIQPVMNMNMTSQSQPNKPADTMALVGMILGIVSLCLCCFNLLDIPVAIAGLVLGILGVKSTKRKGMAIAGIVCSAIAVLLCISVFINGLEYSSQVDDLEDILREFEYMYD